MFDLSREQVSDRYEIIRYGGGGAPSVLICGAFRFDHPAGRQLLSQLPRLITVQRWNSPRADWIQSTLHFIAEEARELRAGGETLITRLADILVIQAIRSWLEQDPAARTGWLRAVQDAQIGRAMSLIHRDPSRAWTVESLAAEAAMSRAAFAARFTEIVGEPVMHYVTRWRMHTAMAWLKDGHGPLADVADRLGYRSEAAFSRAFKRITGMSPGAARRGTEGEKTSADTDVGRVAMMPEAHAGDRFATASRALQSSQS